MEPLGKAIVCLGLLLVVVGLVVWLAGGRGWLDWFGRLPGDVRFESGSTRVYFPVVTCIVVSIVLSLVMWLFRR
ncbi:MAG: DUF2905 domain-containing protein [Verrucomicrobiota bacterium JB022]|nr:DUF2905 domain-containing protein [Verrucomicrobiota bacterium JB022]